MKNMSNFFLPSALFSNNAKIHKVFVRGCSSLKNTKPLSLLVFLLLLSQLHVFAEGSKTASPNAVNICALLSAPDINSGPFLNCAEDNRLKFYITDAANQNLYFGFDWREYANTGSPARCGNMYYRIRRPDGSVIVAPTYWDPTLASAGSIDNHAQALAGPNIAGTVPTGYTPLVFDPDVTGEHWIEIYRSNDGGATADVTITGRATGALFDLSVALNAAPYTQYTGRVYSDRWGFAACDNNFAAQILASAEPVLYSYTNDQCILRIDFEVGFQPIAFNVAVNKYGVNPVGTWDITRKSATNVVAPTLLNGYKIFLNIPDATIFPVSAIPVLPQFRTPAITGCGPYTVHFTISEPGDVKLILDLNGTPGYQAASADVLLEAYDLLAGNNSIAWNGLNGLGAPVASGTSCNLGLTFYKGRFNLPLQDAELNKNGIRISLIAPILVPNARMFWDDSQVTNVGGVCNAAAHNNNNVTGAGINNSIIGTLSPAHAWSGDGNLSQTIPAPAVGTNETDGLQCSDFGNVRTLNTWGWASATTEKRLSFKWGGPA